MRQLVFLLLASSCLPMYCAPNFILVLTDDQDSMLAGWTTMPAVRKLIVDEGMDLTNYFVSTPICCPSRSEMLSGRYGHNIRDSHFEDQFFCYQPPWTSCGCMRMNTSSPDFEPHNFGVYLKQAGYHTGYFGKYLNWPGMASFCDVSDQGKTPPGWSYVDVMCNDSMYQDVWWNKQGKVAFSKEYGTARIGNSSTAWLKEVVAKKEYPFFMVAAPHAPHKPYLPAPWYKHAQVPSQNPRLPSYNASASGHVPWLAAEPPLNRTDEEFFDQAYADRARTLLSVEDIVVSLVKVLEDAGELHNTYIIYTSDHGFHLGEFRLPDGKTHPYDFDIRVPAAIRGPGIKPKSKATWMASNIDLAPTFFELAGLHKPPRMDGYSFAPLLLNKEAPAREILLVDYYSIAPPIKNYSTKDRYNDMPNNTYRALRMIKEGMANFAYIEYSTVYDWWFQEVNFYEFYDLSHDPYQLVNLYPSCSSVLKAELKTWMNNQWYCRGSDTVVSNCSVAMPTADLNKLAQWAPRAYF